MFVSFESVVKRVLSRALRGDGNTATGRLFHPREFVPTRFLAALDQQQIAWMSEARPGETPGGACITSYRTSEADIKWVVAEINRLAPPGEQYAGTGQQLAAAGVVDVDKAVTVTCGICPGTVPQNANHWRAILGK